MRARVTERSVIYNQIGHGYRTHRAADPRIAKALIELVGAPRGSIVCDIGAGSGNYASAFAAEGYRVLAVEPSDVMRAQASSSIGVTWLEGVAENLPLPDACADATICVLAVHHFQSLTATVLEMDRVCKNGPLVFFTFDPRESQPLWFDHYFPEIIAAGQSIVPPIEEFINSVQATTRRRGEVHNFPLPNDLVDGFMLAKWNTPEAYFDAGLRANHSGFAKADQRVVNRGLERLRADLSSGVWDKNHGHLRSQDKFDAGYRFLVFRK